MSRPDGLFVSNGSKFKPASKCDISVDPLECSPRRENVLRSKIMTVGRMQRMFKAVRQAHEAHVRLRWHWPASLAMGRAPVPMRSSWPLKSCSPDALLRRCS